MNRFAHGRAANALVTAGTHSSSHSAANFPHVWATDERLCSHWTTKHRQYRQSTNTTAQKMTSKRWTRQCSWSVVRTCRTYSSYDRNDAQLISSSHGPISHLSVKSEMMDSPSVLTSSALKPY